MSYKVYSDIFDSFTNFVITNFDAQNFDAPVYRDLIDNGSNYSVKIDVPGFEKEEINIEIINDVLKIQAKNSENTKKLNLILPKNAINKEAVSSSLKNGQLTITFPKKTKEPSNTIKVKVG